MENEERRVALIKRIRQARIVAVDSVCFIYAFEEHPLYGPFCRRLFNLAEREDILLITSVVTLTEVLVKPLRLGREDLVSQYQAILDNPPGLRLYPIDRAIAIASAEMRAEFQLLLPDAYQFAVAQSVGASIFITNDKQLSRVGGIEVVQLAEYFG